MLSKTLISMLMPPAVPIEQGENGAWRTIEQNLGTVLPSDYKDFIALYGTGRIAGFIWVFNPFAVNENLNLISQAARRLEAHRSFKALFPEAVPFPLFPERGGLLPCGATDNGDVLFWLTDGKPDRWGMVVAEARCEQHERFDVGLTEFLVGILSGHRESQILSGDLSDVPIEFSQTS